jgi:hypothetical protein
MKFNKWTVALAAAGLVNLGSVTQAEEASNAVMTSLSKTTISGYVDTSATWADGSKVPVGRTAYQGAGKMDGFNLDVFKLVLEKPMDESDWASGYRVDLLVGPDAVAFNGVANGTAGGGADAVEGGEIGIKQAYVATRAPIGNGVDLKMGVFDTIIGYEVFENGANPNYSRSFAFNLQPFQHTGVLASYQVNDMISVSGGLANTAASVINDRPRFNGRSDGNLTYLASATIVAPESTGFLEGSALYVGIVDGVTGGGDDQTNFYAGATMPTPVDGLALGLAYDYVNNVTGATAGANLDDAQIFGAYLSYQATDKMALHGRVEYVDGDPGLYYGGADDNELLGLTATLDYSLWDNVITRLEGRWDQQLDNNANAYGSSDDIFTLTLNAIYNF